jgi:hypothetical protein
MMPPTTRFRAPSSPYRHRFREPLVRILRFSQEPARRTTNPSSTLRRSRGRRRAGRRRVPRAARREIAHRPRAHDRRRDQTRRLRAITLTASWEPCRPGTAHSVSRGPLAARCHRHTPDAQDARQLLSCGDPFTHREASPNQPRRRASTKSLLSWPKADAGTRTPDPFITSEVLYQLSYVGVAASLTRLSRFPDPARPPRVARGITNRSVSPGSRPWPASLRPGRPNARGRATARRS